MLDVHFLGPIIDERKVSAYMFASDIMVVPGRLGLIVIHSYCFDLPVISQENIGTSQGEGISFLKHGETGYLVQDGNLNEMTQCILQLLHSEQLQLTFKENIRKTLQEECGFEKMMSGFEDVITFVNKNERID